jgi:hypothetical protein
VNTTNRIQIAGPYERLFNLASDIARWPDMLPHYRWVKILKQCDGTVIAEMAARHKGLPLWWKTIQRPLPQDKRIEFEHIGGVTKGMHVQWTFTPLRHPPRPLAEDPDDAREVWLVEIHHEFNPAWGPLKPWLADRLIGEIFVKQVANKTLHRIKEITEGRASLTPTLSLQGRGS